MDFQGVEKARPYVEQAHVVFPNAVDAENRLGDLFGFRAIPNAVFIDEAGIIRYIRFAGFDIRMPADRVIADGFAHSPTWRILTPDRNGDMPSETMRPWLCTGRDSRFTGEASQRQR